MSASGPYGPVGDDGLVPRKFTAVVKSDTTDLSLVATKGLWIGGTGDATIKGADDTVAVTFTAVPAGTFLRGHFSRVMAATTATNIVAAGG